MKVFYILILISGFLNYTSHAQKVITYPAPPQADEATDFIVKLNGKESFVYHSEVAAFTNFSFEGTINVEIECRNDIKWVDIRPKNENIQPVFSDHTITFQITEPCHLSVELNGENTRPLYIFANPLEEEIARPDADNVHFFEAGKIHNPGTIELEDNAIVYIEGGAIVKGNIVAREKEGIKILGRGILDGTDVPPGRNNRMILLDNCTKSLIDGIIIFNSLTWTVVPIECDDLTIHNLKQVNWDHGSDGIDLVGCTNVNIEGCFLRNNDDCIVIKSFDYFDKYGKGPQSGRPVKNINVSNTVFWNMAWGNAIEIGFELRTSSISDITFRNCDIINVERGATLSIHNGDQATVQNITYEDIRVENAQHKLIDLAIFLSQYSFDRPSSEEERAARYKHGAWDGVQIVHPAEEEKYAENRGYIKNIHFKNIAVVDGPFPFSIISGYNEDHLVENVTIENLVILGQKIEKPDQGRFHLENTENIQFKP